MPVKINELVVQVKVYGGAKEQAENAVNMPAASLLNATADQHQLLSTEEVVKNLLEDEKAR